MEETYTDRSGRVHVGKMADPRFRSERARRAALVGAVNTLLRRADELTEEQHAKVVEALAQARARGRAQTQAAPKSSE